jgi:hypothetical protein
LVSYLQGDFRGVSRLDLVAQAMPALRALPSSTMRMRLLAREAEGDRLIGEYTFAHTARATGQE